MDKGIEQDNSNNITEAYSPRYRRGNFKDMLLNKRNIKSNPTLSDKQFKLPIQEGILNNFTQISGYINTLDEMFKARMQVHEEEIINIAHSEIKKIQLETDKIVRKYSQLIKEKNIDTQILDLKYEVRFYQQRACEMFEENKQLKRQLKTLRQEIQLFKFGEETSHLAMQKISKAYLKEKTIRKKMEIGKFRSVFTEGSDSNIKISVLSHKMQEKGLLSLTRAQDSSLKKSQEIKNKPQVNFFTTNVRPVPAMHKMRKLKSITQSTQDHAKTQPSQLQLPTV